MPTKQYIEKVTAEFDSCLKHLQKEFSRLQIGRATPALIEDLKVQVYGGIQPIKAVASISPLDAHTLQIQPWDKSVLAEIEKGIRVANLNLNPVNDGKLLRITVPALTQERREELCELVKKLAEEAKITVRKSRQFVHDKFKELEKGKEISEDEQRLAEKHLQQQVDKINEEVQKVSDKKCEEIMTI